VKIETLWSHIPSLVWNVHVPSGGHPDCDVFPRYGERAPRDREIQRLAGANHFDLPCLLCRGYLYCFGSSLVDPFVDEIEVYHAALWAYVLPVTFAEAASAYSSLGGYFSMSML
jgi:hypothetical protein